MLVFFIIGIILAYFLVSVTVAGVSSAIDCKKHSNQANIYLVVPVSLLWPITLPGIGAYFVFWKGAQRLIHFIAVKMNPEFRGWW